MKNNLQKTLFGCLSLLIGAAALAKLPPASDEAKAKAAEAATKAAWSAKVDAFHLCKAQDRVAAHVKKAKAIASTCADPGPFVATPAVAAAPATAAAPAAPAKKP